MTASGVRFLAAGDTALTVEFGDAAVPGLAAQILAFHGRIEGAEISGLLETVPTLRSLTVHYDPLVTSHDEIKRRLEPLTRALPETCERGRSWTIPVCYDPAVAPDIEAVGRETIGTAAAVAELHASVRYTVYMLGFLPGLPYMGDLPEALRLPRRESPRTNVPAGSVAIATTMSAIYPLNSPGGWHLIGRTPIRLFEPRRTSPVLLSPADTVCFRPISLSQFEEMGAKAADGTWDLTPDAEVS